MQLAVMDQNAHVGRHQYYNKQGEGVFLRKYRKSSKQWDATLQERRNIHTFLSLWKILEYKENN